MPISGGVETEVQQAKICRSAVLEGAEQEASAKL